MSRRLTGDSLSKKVPVRFNPGSSNAITDPKNLAANKFSPPKSSRLGGHIHSCYIDDQALVFTSQLPPDIAGCPRFQFYALQDPESGSQVTVHKNALIDSYYPTIECDYSEGRASEKSRIELSNINESEIPSSDCTTVTHLQTRLKKSSIDSRTFTIYSCKSENRSVCETDNPQPEGPDDFDESSETLSGLECLCQLRKRIEKLEEKLQQTLGKSIEIQKAAQNKSRSVQKLFRMVSGAIDRNGKPKLHQLPSQTVSNNSDTETENELRSIKKRLRDLEKKLKKEKKITPRDFFHSTTANSSLLKVSVDDEYFGGNKMMVKESDYTEPIHSDTDSHVPNECSFKKKKKITEGKTKPKVKQRFLSKCKILKTNLNKKLSNVSDEHHSPETQSFDDETIRLVSPVDLTHVTPHRGRNFDPEWNRKRRKKRRKKNRNLCKKNSKMNILTEETGERKQIRPKEELMISWVSDQSQKLPKPWNCAECPHKDLNVPPHNLNKSFRSSYENLKTVDAKHRKPSDFLKCGRNVKFPVLFKEFWESKSVLVERKASTACLRFAFNQGQKDPLAKLKKLVKKLSQSHASPGRTNARQWMKKGNPEDHFLLSLIQVEDNHKG